MSGHSKGKRAGARPPRARAPRGPVLGYAGAITLAVVAWGYLVWAAIDFGATARGGDHRAWWFLGLAALGAMACLFVGLLLLARLGRALGLVAGPDAGDPSGAAGPATTRPAGGKRAAR